MSIRKELEAEVAEMFADLIDRKPPTGVMSTFAKKMGFDVPKRQRTAPPRKFGGSIVRDVEIEAALATIRQKIGFTTTNASIIRQAVLALADHFNH